MESSKSNQWERATKLLASALSLIMNGSRSVEAWVEHLQVFVFGQLRKALVNYDDPAHHRIDHDQFFFAVKSLSSEDFPVRGKGQCEVVYGYLELDHHPFTNKDVFNALKGRRDVRLPDFAETMAYHMAYPNERMLTPIISFCGSIEDRKDRHSVAYIYAHKDGLNLTWNLLSFRWNKFCRLLVVKQVI